MPDILSHGSHAVPETWHAPAADGTPPHVSGPRHTPPLPALAVSSALPRASCQTLHRSHRTPLHSKNNSTETLCFTVTLSFFMV